MLRISGVGHVICYENKSSQRDCLKCKILPATSETAKKRCHGIKKPYLQKITPIMIVLKFFLTALLKTLKIKLKCIPNEMYYTNLRHTSISAIKKEFKNVSTKNIFVHYPC